MSRLTYACLALLALAGPVAAQEAAPAEPAPASIPAPPPAAAQPAPPPAAAQPAPPPLPAAPQVELDHSPPGMAEGRNQLLRDRRFAPRDAQAEAEFLRRAEATRARREAILE